MVLNDTYSDVVALKVHRNLTWEEISDRMNIRFSQNVIDAAHRGNLPDSFVKLVETLGYDIEIQYKNRETGKNKKEK